MKDTTYDEYTRRMDEVTERRSALHEESLELIDKQFKADYGSEEYLGIRGRQAAIEAEREVLKAEWDDLLAKRSAAAEFKRTKYTRPMGRLASPLNRMLGPLPECQLVIQPTDEAMQEVPSYRLQASLLVMALIALVSGLVWVSIWTLASPALLVLNGFYELLGDAMAASFATGFLFLGFMAYFMTKTENSPYQGGLANTMAMSDELWFRTGAESWTRGQRIRAVLGFTVKQWHGLVMTLPSLLVFGVLGTVLMWVYLREYRRTGDTRLATLASAKFHATCYRALVAIMVAAICVALISTYV